MNEPSFFAVPTLASKSYTYRGQEHQSAPRNRKDPQNEEEEESVGDDNGSYTSQSLQRKEVSSMRLQSQKRRVNG